MKRLRGARIEKDDEERMLAKYTVIEKLEDEKNKKVEEYMRKNATKTAVKKKRVKYRWVDDGKAQAIQQFIHRNYSSTPAIKKAASPRLGESY